VRLISRTDTTLAVALIVGTAMVFQRPLRWALQVAHEIEQQYHVDLLPALTVLTVVFLFHQYRKRHEAREQVHLIAADAAVVRARSQELERLMVCGQALANALDRPTLQHVLSRALATFTHDRECWVLASRDDRWEPLVEELTPSTRRPVESLEALAAAATERVSAHAGSNDGVEVHGDVCFPLVAGGAIVGVMGMRNVPPVPLGERQAFAAAAALIAISVRNVQLLQDTREHGVRDSLTGCLNRGHGLEMLDNELKRARRIGRPVSIVLFDIDHFKAVNDEGGHLQGDAVLAGVGVQLNQILRSTDVRCRYGGDEFLVILPDTPVLGAQQVAECIRQELAALRLSGQSPVSITASIGVATSQTGETAVAALLARADAALYRAKRAGRNRFAVAPQQMGSRATGEDAGHDAGGRPRFLRAV